MTDVVIRAVSMRDGIFSNRLMVGWEHRSWPLSGARPTASLNSGSQRKVSQSSASSPGSGFAGPKTGSAAGDGQHPEAQHPGEPVGDQRRIASVTEAAGQKPGQAESAFRLAQQHQSAIRGDQASVEGRRHFLAPHGWKIDGKRGIVGHGGCGISVAWKEERLDSEFLHDYNELRYTHHPKIRRGVNNPG